MPGEEYAIVLDYLPRGKASAFRAEPLAQVIGKDYFTLLEVVPRSELQAQEEVYVGKDERAKIELIKRRVSFTELTQRAQSEAPAAIEKLVKEKEEKFLEFFNSCGSISVRMHTLELLPGIGKKHMLQIVDERNKAPFKSLEEVESRVKLMPNVVSTITKRIIEELEGEQKYYLFTRPPAKKEERFTRGGPRFRRH